MIKKVVYFLHFAWTAGSSAAQRVTGTQKTPNHNNSGVFLRFSVIFFTASIIFSFSSTFLLRIQKGISYPISLIFYSYNLFCHHPHKDHDPYENLAKKLTERHLDIQHAKLQQPAYVVRVASSSMLLPLFFPSLFLCCFEDCDDNR